MIKLKSINVKVKELKVELRSKIFDIALCCRRIEGESYVMTITSGNDSIHKQGSKHYSNEAIDIRSKDMVNPIDVKNEIKKTLGADFDVIYEGDHIHVEFDPKGAKRIINYLSKIYDTREEKI